MNEQPWALEAVEETVLVRWNYLNREGLLDSEVWHGALRDARTASASTRVLELGLRQCIEVILTPTGLQGTVEFFCTLPEGGHTVGYSIDLSGALTVTMDGLPRFIFNGNSWDSVKLNATAIRD